MAEQCLPCFLLGSVYLEEPPAGLIGSTFTCQLQLLSSQVWWMSGAEWEALQCSQNNGLMCSYAMEIHCLHMRKMGFMLQELTLRCPLNQELAIRTRTELLEVSLMNTHYWNIVSLTVISNWRSIMIYLFLNDSQHTWQLRNTAVWLQNK